MRAVPSPFAALATSLFGLPADPSEGQRSLAASIGEAMLRDLIQQYKSTSERLGPGVLSVRVHNGKDITRWADLDEIRRNLAIAEEYDDAPMVDLQRRILDKLGCIDPHSQALLLLITSHAAGATCKLFVLDADSSVASLRQQMEAYGK